MTDVLDFIGQTFTTDNLGVETATEKTRTVMCEVTSVSQSEFFAAANTELNPELRFTVFFSVITKTKVLLNTTARVIRFTERIVPAIIWNCTRKGK